MKRFSFGAPFRNGRYRHWICGTALLASVSLCASRYWDAVLRAVEAGKDLWTSLRIYFCFLFNVDTTVPPTVLEIQDVTFYRHLAIDIPELKRKLEAFPHEFFSWENFSDYLLLALRKTTLFLNSAVLILPSILILWQLIRGRILDTNNDYNKDSRALTRYKRMILRRANAVRAWCRDFLAFLREHKVWWGSLAVVWCVNLNLAGILLGALAYYFYFAASVDFGGIVSSQLLKLLIDLLLTFSSLPAPLWIALGYLLFDLIRRWIGYKILDAHEAANEAFLESLPIVIFLNGTMGSKKTTTVTDMALSYEIIFRRKALEFLLEIDLMFPQFPWILLERRICEGMEDHEVFNLASCRRLGETLEAEDELFGYDRTLPMTYDNGLRIVSIHEAISDYICSYFLYVIQSSLLISNYSVRVDNVMQSEGNFPLWDFELFRRRPELMEATSRHAHILDFDILRISRQMIEENRNTGSFEFGVVLITEIDKERGNQLKQAGIRRDAFETNQKNDNFNYSLKMGRHPATVCNYPFIRILLDAQRPTAWEADGRELTTEVYVAACSPRKSAMPFTVFLDWFAEWVENKFSGFYTEYRYHCGDNKLPVFLLHRFAAATVGRVKRIRHTFGYMESTLELRDSAHEEQVSSHPYYLATKKIYSDRFSTDCYRAYFAERSLGSGVGIEDYPEYEKTCATLEELHSQNSYFISEMEGIGDDES